MQVKAKLPIDDVIHIALAVYDPKGTYSRHAGVVMASVLRNTDAPVCFHILHDETLTEENRRKLEDTYSSNVRVSQGGISFVDVSDFLKQYYDDNMKTILGVYSKGSVFRLTIPDTVPDVHWAIYLDCDVVVNLDIFKLWSEIHGREQYSIIGWREMEDWPLPDMALPKNKIQTDNYGLSRGRYINSGVIIMNLDKIRARYHGNSCLLQDGLSYIVQKKPDYPDQDFLNAEFLGDIGYVNGQYNEVPVGNYEDVFNYERIWHFYTKGKPWNIVRGCNADILYWDNLMHTPWRDELVVSLYHAAVNGEYYHRHSRDCEKRLWNQLVDNIKNILRIKFRIQDKIDYRRYMKEFQ